MAKTSKVILIDADVVSHFLSAGEIFSIGQIFPYPIKVLNKVYAELERFPKKKREVDNLLNLNILTLMPFPEDNEVIKKEYFYLKKTLFKGDGESACLAVARHTKNILASSNLKDIRHYCNMHGVEYITTMDFLCYALLTGKWDESRCDTFITRVLNIGSKLPVKSMSEYTCKDLSWIAP